MGEIAANRAIALCEGAGLEASLPALLETLEILGSGWRDLPLTEQPPFATDITDDGTPFEFSLALEGDHTELRALAEAQRAPFTLASNWRAGLSANRQIAKRFGASLERFDLISDLFAPRGARRERFALWHAAVFHPRQAPMFKVYLNPQIRGAEAAPELVQKALERLALPHAWQELKEQAAAQPDASFVFFSLDLSKDASARVKVYMAYPHATAEVVERAMARADNHVPGDALTFIENMTGQTGPFDARPMLVCYAFSSESPRAQATLHVPVRCYAAHDAEVLERGRSSVPPRTADLLVNGLSRFAQRPLEAGRGLVTYASFRRKHGVPRHTFYLAPEVYSIRAPRTTWVPTSSAPGGDYSMVVQKSPTLRGGTAQPTMLAAQDEINRQQERYREHPFLKRIEGMAPIEDVRRVASSLTFFVLAFQDMLRLSHASIIDPKLRELARKHEEEDRGHEQWFLQDVQKLGAARDLAWTFSPHHVGTRDVSYGLVSEILRARDDRQRIAVVLCLEAAGAEFFGRIIGLLERLGEDAGLLYFARPHQKIEQNHDVFEADVHDQLLALEVPPDVLGDVLGTVERVFALMTMLADEVYAQVMRGDTSESVA